jgi:hypothetical protein
MASAPIVLTNHISVKAASLNSGYNIQYIRRLLRDGILSGLKVGQLWLIDKHGFDIYLEKTHNTNDSRFGPKSATTYLFEVFTGFCPPKAYGSLLQKCDIYLLFAEGSDEFSET